MSLLLTLRWQKGGQRIGENPNRNILFLVSEVTLLKYLQLFLAQHSSFHQMTFGDLQSLVSHHV
jgi:hypothetical protein